MVEVALLAIKDLSLLMSSALVLILLCLLILRPHQNAFRYVYRCCLVLFFVVGIVRMLASLLDWDIDVDAALLLVINNILFMVGCVFFWLGPRWFMHAPLIARGARHSGSHSHKLTGDESGTVADVIAMETQPQLAEKLTGFMVLQKPYLEPHITVERLAAKLNVSPKLLSSTINNELHMNFFELISNYRVAEAKQRLLDAELSEKPICEIMKSCGFNSKSVFNQAFKKAVGVTPSHYRQQHNQP
jgi:AraC-like DNA-binding protein